MLLTKIHERCHVLLFDQGLDLQQRLHAFGRRFIAPLSEGAIVAGLLEFAQHAAEVVALAGVDDPIEVPVEEVCPGGLLAAGAVVGEVAADRDRPWRVHDAGRGSKV